MALEPGDHVWYFNGQTSLEMNIPQADWFPGFTGPTDYQGHGEEIYNYVVYADEIVRGQPHMRNHPGTYAWLNNNPGNLTGVPGGPDYGQFPGKFNWHHFLIFPDWDTGLAAIGQLLRGPGYAGLSFTDAFARYAPASDGNDPVKYAQQVSGAVGKEPSDIVSDLSDDDMVTVQNAVADIENPVAGDTFSYDSADLPQAITDLLQ